MTIAEALRVGTLVVAFPNVALVLALAAHFARSPAVLDASPQRGQPGGVFRAASVLYVGVATLMIGVGLGQIARLHDPFHWGLPAILIGHLIASVGLVRLILTFPQRRW